MNKDTLTGILGAEVLVAAMTGVIFYDRGQFHEYDVRWEADDKITTTLTAGACAHGDHRTHPFNVTITDALLAQVTVESEWTDNPDDEFGFKVTAPDGSTTNERGSGGRLLVDLTIQEASSPSTVAHRNQEGPLDQAWGQVNETARAAGQSDRSAKVTLHNAMRDNEIPRLDPEAGEHTYAIIFTVFTGRPAVD